MSKPMICARDIAQALESWAKPEYAESYDNVGLHVGSPSREITSVMIALELTTEVLREAIDSNASMIITHHPLLFRPLSRILTDDPTGHFIQELLRHDITLYSIHTNLDAASDGVSFALAKLLDVQEPTFLSPHSNGISGMGAIGKLSHPESLKSFNLRVHQQLGSPVFRYTGSLSAMVHTVAVCGGSGGSLIEAALFKGADVYVTADLSYHRFFEVLDSEGHCQMALIDAGHYETEKHTQQLLNRWLEKRFPSVTFRCTRSVTNPVHYSTV
ncbi:MAG: Nif3-like dinuclear metal center hexameric protein [Bacteroidetes bacterium]|nr:Nif3-like dinuclear metal center hexameric protein [Bacteroidota bacterium]